MLFTGTPTAGASAPAGGGTSAPTYSKALKSSGGGGGITLDNAGGSGTFLTFTVPGGTVSDGDALHITAHVTRTGAAATEYLRFGISQANATIGTPVGTTDTGNQSWYSLLVRGATGASNVSAGTSCMRSSGSTTSLGGAQRITVDWSVDNAFSFFLSATATGAAIAAPSVGDTFTLEGFVIELVKATP